ncbi:putative disease resistance protein RGA1 [Sorghum bicolor]|uniref:Uncharacterized protein n=1 Tax=Sorghum bicolor TaxID=4558 RepID=A0A1B6PTW4_SORBI|nr:putative disease resistance protein RGA1 [Sorghum bicolor]KXG29103.1 hypothetical protein SORBI_3005G212100 [Sorghum bicolor]|eukprot:XP_021316822.1 putative disease resistance protein RGA1 [Sorghum bicolor]
MAELVVGPLLSMVKNKACNYLMDQFKVMQGMEKQRKILERKLPAILDIIQDAEEKGGFRPGVAAWLKDLRTVAYEANDVFDEFNYEALRRQAKKKGHHSKLSMEVVDRNPIVFRYRMGKKLRKIVQTIEVLVTEMNAFGFSHLQQAPASKPWRISDSILVDSDKDIVSRSRDKEKNKIVGILLHEASKMDLLVLPIVGMGGLGKTTFIQLVYNDPAIQKHFQLQRWCSVSDSFDIANIASRICQTNENDQGSENALKNLQKLTNGKRYLIVLDDVWNRDEAKWEKLLTCLKQGDKGSTVLATTRDKEVARIMAIGASESYNLEKLSNKHLKEIVQSRAFSLENPYSDELVGILDTIVDRCAGSPLVAKVFGSMLSTRKSLKEWKDISTKSNICNERTGILPMLKLSFEDLPSHMKQCFALCAIFPKNYEIAVELLIELWMAHDLIPVREDEHPETAGEEVFKELTWRSFFGELKQKSPFDYGERLQLRTGTICKIHDLMHDIALSVAGKECATIVDEPSMKKLLQNPITRHLFWSHESNDFLKKESPSLRTLFCTDYGSFRHISKYTSLRALHLPHMELCRVEMRQLQHLRYLNLSGNLQLKEFPEDLSILYNLQTLNLSHCEQLRQLPKDMKYMASLRHLYTNGCKSLTCMPPGLGQITSLQTITYFVVGACPGCSTIRELQNLNLGGELELNCLENATEALAKSASLQNKEKLTHLSLEWNSEGQEKPVQDCHQKVLHALKPHGGLQMLRIVNYKGNRLPLWITDHSQLQHLTELRLLGCMLCEEFPWFSHFKALEVLHLEKLNKLQSLCSDMSSMPFPALKELQLHDLESLERWVATEGKEDELAFPVLEELDIENCPKLTSLPEAPKLKVMRLDEDKVLLSSAVVSRHMSSLSKLQLCVRDTEETPPQVNQDHESSLAELILQGCQFFFSSDAWKCFRMVVCLEITGCDFLVYWPEEIFQSMASLKNLGISNCSNLIGATLEKNAEPIQTTTNQVLPYLDMINIFNCDSLKELFMLPLSRCIDVCDCPRLEHIWRDDKNSETSTSRSHTCLEAICIARCANLVTLPNLPPSLKDLQVGICVALRSVSGHLDALENLIIIDCGNLVELPDLPPTLKELRIQICGELCYVSGSLDALEELQIDHCNKLQSLESIGDLPLLQILRIESCNRLAVLPGNHGSYLSLRELRIKYCPAIDMKQLYSCHQQRLDGLEDKDVSHAHSRNPFEGPKLREPKTWHYAVPWCRDWAIWRHIN